MYFSIVTPYTRLMHSHTRSLSVQAAMMIALTLSLFGCQKSATVPPANPVANYLMNAEMQYETKDQATELRTVLQDMIALPKDALAAKRYADDAGTNQWTAQDVIIKHVVPDGQKALGDHFYLDAKAPQTQEKIKILLQKLPQ